MTGGARRRGTRPAARALAALEVDVLFVLISGDPATADSAPKGVTAVLPKPVSPETLIETVKNLLSR